MEKAALNTWNYCTNAAIKRASRRLGQLYDAAIAPAGLRSTQHALLSQIRNLGDPTLRSLASVMVMDLSALGHTLKPLIRDGFVELVPDERDRRAKRAKLTAQGCEKQVECELLWREAQARFDALLGVDESAALRTTLDRLSSDEFAKAFAGS